MPTEGRESILGVFLDPSKAFDCSDLKRYFKVRAILRLNAIWLLDKLESHMDANWTFYTIVYRIITKRPQSTIQFVKQYSKSMNLSFGVLQGSVLGPLLFYDYVNENGPPQ